MKLENQVTSLELSKKLKELGVKQESHFWWSNCKISFIMEEGNEGEIYVGSSNDGFEILDDECIPDDIVYSKEDTVSVGDRELYSAFTVAELGEMLPKEYWVQKNIDKNRPASDGKYIPQSTNISFGVTSLVDIQDISEANARAKMLIYLLENNLLKDEQEGGK